MAGPGNDRKIADRKMGGNVFALSSFSCQPSCHCCLACVLLVLTSLVAAEEPATPNDGEQALREKWQAMYLATAQSFDMREGETKLALHDKPILFYTSPVRTNDQHGSLFLWTHEGRPAVIGSIWSGLNVKDRALRNVTHEFHSLSERPDVQAARGGPGLSKSQAQWSAGEPGIAWLTLVGSPAPASSRAGRLSQMRAAARRLTASITAVEASELRLMPQPLYRYPEKTPGSLDGALFVFALATDPELIVLIEQTDDAQAAMRVAFARFGNLPMSVKDDERELWSCDKGTPGRSEGKYYLHWRIEQRKADLSP
jgi:hypothetical protein